MNGIVRAMSPVEPNGFLSPFATDAIALLGAAGSALTAIGLAIAIWQLWANRKAQERVAEAVERAMEEQRRGFDRFVVAHAQRCWADAQRHVEQEAWRQAAMRLSDLAQYATQISQVATVDRQRKDWAVEATELRKWVTAAQRAANGKNFTATKWLGFVESFSGRLDNFVGPYNAEQGDDDEHPADS